MCPWASQIVGAPWTTNFHQMRVRIWQCGNIKDGGGKWKRCWKEHFDFDFGLGGHQVWNPLAGWGLDPAAVRWRLPHAFTRGPLMSNPGVRVGGMSWPRTQKAIHFGWPTLTPPTPPPQMVCSPFPKGGTRTGAHHRRGKCRAGIGALICFFGCMLCLKNNQFNHLEGLLRPPSFAKSS